MIAAAVLLVSGDLGGALGEGRRRIWSGGARTTGVLLFPLGEPGRHERLDVGGAIAQAPTDAGADQPFALVASVVQGRHRDPEDLGDLLDGE